VTEENPPIVTIVHQRGQEIAEPMVEPREQFGDFGVESFLL
jgi:hypothetical protein